MTVMTKARKPYLIQRGKVQSFDPTKRFSQNVSTAYMGSSEFEFGAMSKSLRRMETDFDNYIVITLNEFKNQKNQSLRVMFNPNRFSQDVLIDWLTKLRKNEIRTKERHEFDIHFLETFNPDEKPDQFIRGAKNHHDYMVSKLRDCDFWWDIENDFMFSFNKKIMNNIKEIVKSSLDYMNSL